MPPRNELENDPRCWRYVGKRGGVYHGRNSRKYREAYERLRGPIPPGLVLDHLCLHEWCVNPWHLEPVTQKENMRRAGIYGGDAQVGNAAKTHCKHGPRVHGREHLPGTRLAE
jgi:hypothetical protein